MCSDHSYKTGLRVLVCTSTIWFLYLRNEEKQSNSSFDCNELKMTGISIKHWKNIHQKNEEDLRVEFQSLLIQSCMSQRTSQQH